MIRISTALIIIVHILLMMINPVVSVVSEEKNAYSISEEWVRRYKIMPGDDKPYCVAEKDNYIYVTGIGNNGNRTYVFKISKDRGYIVKTWNMHIPGCFIELHDCKFIGNYLYVVGIGCSQNTRDDNLLLLIFDENLNVVVRDESNPTLKSDWFHALTTDGNYLYVAGGINGTGGYKREMTWFWRIEKRKIDDLSLINSYTSDKIYGGRPFDIEINPVSNHLWIIGSDRREREKIFLWSILILDGRDLRFLKTVEPGIEGEALTLCFDKEGYAYVGGDNVIMKLDKNGEIIALKEYKNITFSKSLCLDDMIFVVGDMLRANRTRNQMAMLMNLNLEQLAIKILHDPTNATSSYFDLGSLDYDGKYIYVAGHEETKQYNGSFGWVVYKLALKRNNELITKSITKIKPTTQHILAAENIHNLTYALLFSGISLGIVAGYIVIRRRYKRKRRISHKKHRK